MDSSVPLVKLTPVAIAPAERTLLSKTDHLFEKLGQAIVSGEYKFGFLSSELAVEKCYNVSRSVAREAVRMLRAKGIVSSSTKQGISLNPMEKWNLVDPDILRWIANGPFSADTFEEITQLRLAVEPRSAHLAAIKSDPFVCQTLRQHYDGMQKAKCDPDRYIEAQIAFHVCIVDATKNRFMRPFQDLITTAFFLLERSQYLKPGASFLTDYWEIVDSIEKSKPQIAEYAMKYIIGAYLQ
jgi:DNA-binding FadR family transcriptional regulator